MKSKKCFKYFIVVLCILISVGFNTNTTYASEKSDKDKLIEIIQKNGTLQFYDVGGSSYKISYENGILLFTQSMHGDSLGYGYDCCSGIVVIMYKHVYSQAYGKYEEEYAKVNYVTDMKAFDYKKEVNFSLYEYNLNIFTLNMSTLNKLANSTKETTFTAFQSYLKDNYDLDFRKCMPYKKKNGVVEYEGKLAYYKDDNIVTSYTGFAKNYSTQDYYYVVKGIVKTDKTGVFNGTVKGVEADWYVKNGKVLFIDTVVKTKNGRFGIKKGKVDYTYTGFISNDKGIWYIKNGIADEKTTGMIKGKDKNGKSVCYYVVDSRVKTEYIGFVKNSGSWWYCEKGKFDFKKRDIIKGKVNGVNTWWYIENGKVSFINSVEHNSKGWWRIKNGRIDFDYTGLAQNEKGWWYCVNGKVNLKKTDVIKGKVDGITTWWYVKNGKVGFVDTVAKNSNGWWRIKNGRIDFDFTGFAKNTSGWWYCIKGKVDQNKTAIIYDTINGEKAWWYCCKGKADLKKTDVVKGKVNNITTWWYIKNGKVNFVNTVAKNSNGLWRIKNGRVDFGYNGFAKNDDGWWYCSDGKVNTNRNDIIKGIVNGDNAWWYVKNGKVQFVTSVEKNSSGWWYIRNGKIDFSYTGFAKNSSGWWYCKNGKVDDKIINIVKGNVDGKTANWYVKNGKVQIITGLVNIQGEYIYVEKGMVSYKFCGLVKNNSGLWYCKNSKVDFTYNGRYFYNNLLYDVIGGKAIIIDYEKTMNKLVDQGMSISKDIYNNFFFSLEAYEWRRSLDNRDKGS